MIFYVFFMVYSGWDEEARNKLPAPLVDLMGYYILDNIVTMVSSFFFNFFTVFPKRNSRFFFQFLRLFLFFQYFFSIFLSFFFIFSILFFSVFVFNLFLYQNDFSEHMVYPIVQFWMNITTDSWNW